MRKKPNLAARLERCDSIMIHDGVSHKNQWKEDFHTQEIHLEIGCGKGRFITESAKRNPNVLFVAVEREQGALVMAMERALKERLHNVLFLDFDAAKLQEIFGEHEVYRIYLNFSDPWPKKKQAKRRLTHHTFLNIYRSILQENGEIFIKTDNEKLFEFTLNELSACDFAMSHITFDLHGTDFDNIVTEYEERFLQQGMRIFRVEARKGEYVRSQNE